MAGNDVVNSFFDENNTPQAWRDLIVGDENETASDALRDAIMAIPNGCIPERNLILRALTYQPPSEIKAIIVGRDPITNARLATGLGFSFPLVPVDEEAGRIYNNISKNIKRMMEGKKTLNLWGYEKDKWTGKSMARMKQALMNAGIETVNDTGNFCYEHWAERGVLLWNSCLTYNPATGTSCDRFWLPFTKRLISLVLQTSKHKPVLGMFWGTPADEVYESVVSDVARGVPDGVVESVLDGVAEQVKGNRAMDDVSEVWEVACDEADGVTPEYRRGLEPCWGCLSYSHPTFQIEGYPDFLTTAAASEQFASRPELFRPASEADADQGVDGLNEDMGAMGIQ